MKEIVITSATRTAIGSLSKSLKNISAEELGSTVISKAISNSKLKNNEPDEVVMGQVLTGGSGQNPARQSAMKSGISKETPAYVINQVCGSGLRSVAAGYQSLKTEDAKILIAGGQENMSLAPHVMHLRDGKKLGDQKLIDTMIKDGLWDAFHGYHMGVTAENVAEKFQVSRVEQDNFALRSQEKALKAQQENKFDEEIVNMKIKSKKAEIIFNKDEHPREGITLESLSRLKPVFKKDGTVTAGNSSGINDGAAAVIMMSREEADKRELNKLVSNQITAQPDLCPKINNWTDPNSAFIASAFENHFKAANWKNPHSTQFYGVSTCGVDVNRKNVSGNLGLTCIDRDFWGKKFEIGTNVSDKGEKMFTLVSVD